MRETKLGQLLEERCNRCDMLDDALARIAALEAAIATLLGRTKGVESATNSFVCDVIDTSVIKYRPNEGGNESGRPPLPKLGRP